MDHYTISIVSKFPLFFALICIFMIGAFGRKNFIFRAFLFSYSVFFGFLLYLILLSKEFLIEYIPGFIFELFSLVFFLIFINRYIDQSTNVRLDYELLLRKLAFVKIFILFYLVGQSGFGIFHAEDQIRISFLANNKYNKYIVYLWSTLLVVEAVAIANTYSSRRGFTLGTVLIVVLNLLYSLLSGSKGGVILWLITIAAFFPNNLSFYLKRSYRVWPFFIIIFFLVVYYGARFEGLNLKDFFNLVFNRFFLSNDSRAMSLDYQSSYQSLELFLMNSFRGFASVFGWMPTDQPLGNVLYEHRFNIVDGRGGNASYSALMNYYLEPHLRVMVSIFSAVSLFFLFAILYLTERLFRNIPIRLFVVAMSANLFRVLSQDFLAFPLVLVSTTLLVLIFFIFRNSRSLGFAYER